VFSLLPVSSFGVCAVCSGVARGVLLASACAPHNSWIPVYTRYLVPDAAGPHYLANRVLPRAVRASQMVALNPGEAITSTSRMET